MTERVEPRRRSLERGSLLGERYRIERMLGRGGMGAVYEALRLDLGRRVALKVLDAAVGAEHEALEATEREALAAAGLAHPHIVQVIDFHRGATDPSPSPPFFVMELLEGESLDARLHRASRIDPGTAALVMVQVLSALAAAHASGILHRDVKPANVFLTHTAAGFDFVKLLDFGIAWNLSPLVSTRGAAFHAGTPAYMAPEQIRGGRLDARTDVWSAGVCLYEMLSGSTPFEGENVATLLLAVCEAEPRRLEERCPWVDSRLAAVVHRALAKEPEDRHASAEAMRAALAPFALAGAVPSRDLARGGQGAAEAASTVRDPFLASTAEALPLVSRFVPPPIASVPRGVDSSLAPPARTLASGALTTASAALANPRKPLRRWLARGMVAATVLGLVALGIGRRGPSPGLSRASAEPPVCTFAAAKSFGTEVATLQLGASETEALMAVTSTGRPAPGLQFASIARTGATFDPWPSSPFEDTAAPGERFMPCALEGPHGLVAGGVRARAETARFPSLFAIYERAPRGPGTAAQLYQNYPFAVSSNTCVAAESMTVFAGTGPDPREPGGVQNVRIVVFDGPRRAVASHAIGHTNHVELAASIELVALFITEGDKPYLYLFDPKDLDAPGTSAAVSPEPAGEGSVATGPAGTDLVWIDTRSKELRWTRYTREPRPLGQGVLARGDLFAPRLVRREGQIVIAYGERKNGITRVHVGIGATPLEAMKAITTTTASADARGIVVAGAKEPWIGWIEGAGAGAHAQVAQLACGRPSRENAAGSVEGAAGANHQR